jgi:hypothetical protein
VNLRAKGTKVDSIILNYKLSVFLAGHFFCELTKTISKNEKTDVSLRIYNLTGKAV